jgi:LysR family nitrogen assimilation transcriptional regulator
MDVKKLKQFLAIVEAGSLSAAAKRLNIAQPALTHSVQSLEDELGVALLERHARGVALTEFGSLLADRANAILREVDRAKALIRERVANPSGGVRVAIPPLLAGGVAMPLLARLRERLPGVGLTIIERDAGLAREAVLSAQADMALSYGTEADIDVTLRPLVVEELTLGVPPASPLAGRHLAITDLDGCEFILPPKGDPIRAVVDEAVTRHGVKLMVAAELAAPADLIAGLIHGLATIAPPYALAGAARQGLVGLAVLNEPRLPACLFLMLRRHTALSRPAQAVHDMILQTIETLVRSEVWPGRYVGHMPSSASMISIFTNQA